MEEDEAPGSSLGAMLAAAADDSDDSGSQDGDFDPSKGAAAAADSDDGSEASASASGDSDSDSTKKEPEASGAAVGAEEDSDDDDVVLKISKKKKKKKKKNKRKKRAISDDEDEGEDIQKRKGRGFLDDEAEADDDDDEEDDDDGSAVEDLIDDTEIVQHKKKKRKTRIDDDEKELDVDDLDLLVENLGQDAKVLKNKDYKRLKINRTSDAEEDELEAPASLAFADDTEQAGPSAQTYRTDGLDEYSSEDDWIVDDAETEEAKKRRKAAKKKSRQKMTEQEKEAAEIFGTSVLRMLGDAQDDGHPSEDEEDPEARERRKVQKIRQTYAPDEVERHFLTEKDDAIRIVDLPERVQQKFGDFRTRYTPSDDLECRKEAEWIYDRVYGSSDRVSAIADRVLVRILENRSRSEMLRYIPELVKLLRWEDSKRIDDSKEEVDCSGPREVPFIAQYRKELVGFPHVLSLHDLWLIKEWDEKWHDLNARKLELQTTLRRVQWLQNRLRGAIQHFARENPVADDYSLELQREECCRLVRGAKEIRTHNPPYFDWLLANATDDNPARKGEYHLSQLDGTAEDEAESALGASEAVGMPVEAGVAAEAPRDPTDHPEEMNPFADSEITTQEVDQLEQMNPFAGTESTEDTPADEGDSSAADGEGAKNSAMDLEEAELLGSGPSSSDMQPDDGQMEVEAELLGNSAGSGTERVDGEEKGAMDVEERLLGGDSDQGAEKRASPVPDEGHVGGSAITSRTAIVPSLDLAFDVPPSPEELAIKRRVLSTDFDSLAASKTEEELDIVHENLLLHMEDDFGVLQTYESDLLNWCNTVLETFGARVNDFHRSWWDGQALCMIVKACLKKKEEVSGGPVDVSIDINEGEPVANLNEAKSRALDELNIKFDFDSVTLLCCKNPHCGPREQIIREVEDESSGNRGFLCQSCRPDELTIIRATTQLRDCIENLDDGTKTSNLRVSRQFGRGAKRARKPRFPHFDYARRSGLLGFVNVFGLTTEEFAGNLQMMFMQYEPKEPKDVPILMASEYLGRRYKTEEDVLEVAQTSVASQLARDPQVYALLKEKFLQRATLTVRPTPRGKKDIEDWHPFARYKYITNKWLQSLQDTDYLWIKKAEDEGQLETKIEAIHDEDTCSKLRIDPVGMFWDQLEKCYLTDFTSSDVGGAWNDVRRNVLRAAVAMLFKRIEKEVRATLLREAQKAVLAKCANHLRSKLSRAPFQSDRVGVDEGSDIQVVAVVPGDERGRDQMPTYAVLLGTDGEMVDFLRLDWFLVSKNVSGPHAKKRRQDWDDFREFLHRNQPDAIVIGAADNTAQRLYRDIGDFLAEAAQAADQGEEEPLPNIAVEFGEMQLARLFASSPRSLEEFPDHDPRVRQAVSLGRRFQNSEREFAAAFNQDGEILSLAWHPLQNMVRNEELNAVLEQEMITAVNRSGVDLNACLSHAHAAAMLPFVAGFGPRKASELLKQVQLAKREEGGIPRLMSREHLMIYSTYIGPTVTWTASGFLYTDPGEHGGNALDRTRVHPESYRYAMKIAKDARGELPTQVEGEDDDGGIEAVQRIMDDPGDALDNIDLKVFAAELYRTNHGEKLQTLSDIVRELQAPAKDTRLEYRGLNMLQLFTQLTGETVQTVSGPQGIGPDGVVRPRQMHECLSDLGFDPHEVFAHGPGANELYFHDHIEEMPSLMLHQMVNCEVSRLSYKEADGEPARSVGFSCKLTDTNIAGFVSIMDISDDRTEDAADRVEVGMIVQARITNFNIQRFSVKLSCKSSVLKGDDLTYSDWGWDPDYDTVALIQDREKSQDMEAKKNKYQLRRIDHPLYHNVSFQSAMKLLEDQPAGEVVIRPSSKGVDHLTVSYKVTGTAVAHIDVKEDEKRARDESSLGKKLIIGKEVFESLDEMLATYVNPLVDFARSLTGHKYFRDGVGKDASDEQLRKEKDANPQRNPYCLWYDDTKSTFRLSYLPGRSVKCERITISPEGFKYRDRKFQTIDKLLLFFKKHWADPPPTQRQPFPAQPRHLGPPQPPRQPSALAYSTGPPPAGALGGYGAPPMPPPHGYGAPPAAPPGTRGYGHIPPHGMPPGMPPYGGGRPIPPQTRGHF